MSDANIDLKSLREAAQIRVLEAQVRILEAKVSTVYGKDQRQLMFTGGVDSALVGEAVNALAAYRAIDAGRKDKQPIHIAMNMGSSDIERCMVNPYFDLFALVDYIRFMQEEGYKFTIQVIGQATQHAACLLQVADERIMTEHSRLMFTEERFAVQANSADSRRKVQFHKRLEERARKLVCQRSQLQMERFAEETKYNRHWWIDAKKAQELGLVDAVDVRLCPSRIYTPPANLLPAEGDSLPVRKLKAETRKRLAEAELSEMQAEDIEAERASSDILFIGPVVPKSCNSVAWQLQKQASKPGTQLSLIIYSPGGSVIDGATLLNVVNKLKKEGHTVRTTAIGCAASMGGYLLQAGNERVIGKNAMVMIHRVSSVIDGGGSHADDQERMMSEIEQEVLPVLLDRSKITREEYMKRTEDGGDWWLEAQEAADLKVVDRVR